MNYILYLTKECNLACKYCYMDKNNSSMEFSTIKRVVDNAAIAKDVSDILFFGGEPLLKKDLIFRTIEYCKYVEEKSDCKFTFSLNTNGILIDDEFLTFMAKNKILTGISIDGIKESHDKNRVDSKGEGSFAKVSEKADMLLEAQTYAMSLTVINSDTVELFADSVEFLIEKGFRYLLCGLNYSAQWNKELMEKLEAQFRKIAKIYQNKLEMGTNIYFSPFDVAIGAYINKKDLCRERCELGMHLVAVEPSGKIYPCIQFVGDDDFVLGDVYHGIDKERQMQIFKNSRGETDICSKCSINKRCNHNCGCINKHSTGRVDKVSPVLCSYQRIVVPIADNIAEKLFKKKVPMFIKKFYKDVYPLI